MILFEAFDAFRNLTDLGSQFCQCSFLIDCRMWGVGCAVARLERGLKCGERVVNVSIVVLVFVQE
jgi:hypothetical protein